MKIEDILQIQLHMIVVGLLLVISNGVILQWLCVQQTANKLRTSFPIAFSSIYGLTHCIQVPASFNKHITCLHMGTLSNTEITSYAMGETPVVYFIAIGIS